jgi:hypothetical protein
VKNESSEEVKRMQNRRTFEIIHPEISKLQQFKTFTEAVVLSVTKQFTHLVKPEQRKGTAGLVNKMIGCFLSVLCP